MNYLPIASYWIIRTSWSRSALPDAPVLVPPVPVARPHRKPPRWTAMGQRFGKYLHHGGRLAHTH
jgi:hypothetical protein